MVKDTPWINGDSGPGQASDGAKQGRAPGRSPTKAITGTDHHTGSFRHKIYG